MQAFEATGTIDPSGQITLDQPLQVSHSAKVRVIVLFAEHENAGSNIQTERSESQNFSAESFLSWIDEIRAQVPEEEWKKLPSDLAKNVDHYLYGCPKDEE